MLFQTLYIEEEVASHPRVLEITGRFPEAKIVYCENYGEVFNRSAQSFRLQKQNPSLILARKYKNHVLEAPEGYGIGASENYYFSHMLNCVYDCRYCFLQGMYQSANYVLFVNYEDFFSAIQVLPSRHETSHFFSGYDCDSLALEPVTGFAEACLDFFQQQPGKLLELRTKSTQIRGLLGREAMDNVVVAFSLSPENIAESLEHKTPPLQRRLDAMNKLANAGWKLGLRFDPIIYHANFKQHYDELFSQVFSAIKPESIHSVSLGVFRLPTGFFRKVQKLYPEEKLFAGPMQDRKGMMAYRDDVEQEIMDYCKQQIMRYIDNNAFFPCLYD
ncbi:MAG: DNA photolyase [Gammaproteobacteria bacterium]|nr:DNA photolyase [Gammaproteobacteria bacterium]